MIRIIDVLFSLFGLVIGFPVLLILFLFGWLDTRSPLFWQERVGRQQKPFVLVKFRTMQLETASVASHLADASAVTSYGRFLRKTKLDELPQLWNVLKGEMSLVGPRPCLFNQHALMSYCQIWCSGPLTQAAIRLSEITSIPSLNFTPSITLAR